LSNLSEGNNLKVNEADGPRGNKEGDMDRRQIVFGTATVAAGLALPAQSRAQAKSLQDRLVGAWSLVDIYDEGKDGAKYYPWGEGAQGLIIYTPGGHFSAQTIAAGRDKGASKSPRMPVGPAIGSFGTYTVDEAAMTIKAKIDRCSFPGWDGAERVTKIVLLTDDEMRTEIAVVHDPVNGDVVPKGHYKRVG
jgi:hypothetical protein